MKSQLIVLATLVGVAQCAFGQPPCTNELAWTKPGSWAASGDDLAMADRSYPKAEYPVALRKADQAITLLKKAIANLNGIEAHTYRSLRGDSYTKDGALKFGVNALFLGYYCVPNTAGDPALRGQIQSGGETGTWIYIRFNDFFWLTNDYVKLDKSLRAKGGGAMFYFPKSEGQWKGLPLLLPTIHPGQKTEAVIIAPEGRTPYRFVTREEFLEARVRQVQDKIGNLPQFRNRAEVQARLEDELQRLRGALAALSDQERKTEAIVRNPFVVPGGREPVFATEADGGRRVFVISARFFDTTLPRHALQFITVYWRWETGPQNRPKEDMARQFRENFDVAALRAMLGH